MTPREQGFLLLTSHLGDPERKVLTAAQFRNLTARMRNMSKPIEDRELEEADLIALGYGRETAARILSLLDSQEQLDWYVQKGRQYGCHPITRVSDGYPPSLRKKLGNDCPGCLWAKGDLSILSAPGIALVGSRDLNDQNQKFAREVGKQAALQGFALISGNARGADRAAQESCLAWGGKVISVLADSLEKYAPKNNILYLSEDGFDLAFSAQRALSRNRIIHCLGQRVFVAQSGLYKGGTWKGTANNLQHNRTPVFCCNDGSPATEALVRLGAVPADLDDLVNINALQTDQMNFIDQ